MSLLPRHAHAVRPFATDDARIVSKGQVEIEAWPELVLSEGQLHPGFHMMAGVSVNEWFELIAGGGLGFASESGFAIANPVVQPKFLIWRAEENGIPGLSLATGLTIPKGRGHLYDDATGVYALFPLTSRLFDDWLMIHLNVGFTTAFVPQRSVTENTSRFSARPYWGLGLDVGVLHPDARLIAEAYAGDPFESFGPAYAFQWGARWMASDYVNLDLTFGTQPLVHDAMQVERRWDVWGQLGIRLLFDTFTDGPGDPMGAHGMVKAPGSSHR